MVLEEKGRIFIQQYKESNSIKKPSYSFNIEIYKCVPIINGLQFPIQGGYINIDFDLYTNEFDIKFKSKKNDSRKKYFKSS